MSDNEQSDGMEELQEILNEYSQEKSKTSEKIPHENNKVTPVSTNTENNQPKKWEKSEQEIYLGKALFGDKAALLENLEKSKSRKSKKRNDSLVDTEPKKRKAVWEDEDDDELKVEDIHTRAKDKAFKQKSYKEHLKSRFQRVSSNPKWADLDQKDDPDSDEEILRTVGFIDSTKTAALAPTIIANKKMKNLNRASIGEGLITSIQFHPTSTVAMVSNNSGHATLYSVDGIQNEKLHTIHFDEFPVCCARILNCGTQAMFSGNKKHYYSYDLMRGTAMRHKARHVTTTIKNFEVSPCGKYFAAEGRFGDIYLFDLKSKEQIHKFKQEEECETIQFTNDSTKMITSSVGSYINIFDIRYQRVMHKFLDEGCISGRSLALSPNGKMLATGSKEGAVNIYDYEKVLLSKDPQPEKTLLNLTTSIADLKFNHSSEILAMCSEVTSSAVRLVHFPTGTVFTNFPGEKTGIFAIQSINFSPSSGYMALASVAKHALLFRLKHYNNY